jgi:alpha-beta hydrolase superfamily lysophospholipase
LPGLRLPPSLFVHGKAATPVLTRIPERQRFVENSPYRLEDTTLGYLVSMGDLIEAAAPTVARLDVPVALFSAGKDVFVTQAQTREFFENVRAQDKTRFDYAEAYHQLMFDLDAAQVLADAVGWVEARVPRG